MSEPSDEIQAGITTDADPTRGATEDEAKAVLAALGPGWAWRWTEDEDYGVYGVAAPVGVVGVLLDRGWIEHEVEVDGVRWLVSAEMP